MSAYKESRRKERQAQAIERNAAWAALDYESKIASLHRRRGLCQKQRERLTIPRRDAALKAKATA